MTVDDPGQVADPVDTAPPLLSWDEVSAEVSTKWHGVDTETLGRVLRAHLVVEHHVTDHLAQHNPNLEGIWDARIELSQKLKLGGFPRWLRTLVTQISEVRNQFVHRLDHAITEADVANLRKNAMLKGMLWVYEEARANSDPPTPLHTFELSCFMTAHLLKVWTKLGEKKAELAVEGAAIALERRILGELASEELEDEDFDPP